MIEGRDVVTLDTFSAEEIRWITSRAREMKTQGTGGAPLQGRSLGRNVILIAEKPHEIDLIVEVATRMKIEPQIGIRIRLVARGSGRWERSSGPAAKFGFTLVCFETRLPLPLVIGESVSPTIPE